MISTILLAVALTTPPGWSKKGCFNLQLTLVDVLQLTVQATPREVIEGSMDPYLSQFPDLDEQDKDYIKASAKRVLDAPKPETVREIYQECLANVPEKPKGTDL
jgi:hypothetical protein